MKAVAIKKGQTREKAPDAHEMGTLRCDGCGEEFLINHPPSSADKWVAEKQALWLERVLAEEHERDKKHPDRIELPDNCGQEINAKRLEAIPWVRYCITCQELIDGTR